MTVAEQQVDKNKKVSVKKQGIAFYMHKNMILQITVEWGEYKKKFVVIVREMYVVLFMRKKKRSVVKR
jgi:hypothetical protein